MNFFPMALALSLVATAAHAAETVPTVPKTDAQVFNFENGLTLIVEEDRSAPVASVQAWCGTGSIHEAEWMGAGLSHILEHMLFKGTAKRPPGAIAREVQEQGGYINAYTSFDRTVYWIDVPAAGAAVAVDILADAMQNATLPEDEYVKEQEVIRREFAMGFDDPNRQSTQLMLDTVFTESPLRHPVIGYLDVYNKLTRDDVLRYYHRRYVPNNLTFVVVGDVDAGALRDQLGKLFDTAPRQALDPVFIAPEPPQMGPREIHREFPATELSRLNLAWRIPGLTHPDTPALDILGDILGSGRSSILNTELREKKPLAHSIGAGMYAMQNEGVFAIQAVTDPDKRDAVETESLALVEKIKTDGVTPQQLERARKSLLASQLATLTTARGKASDLGSNWLLTRNLDFGRHYLDAVASVTADDVRRVAREYLSPDKINITSLNPVGTKEKSGNAASRPDEPVMTKFELPNGLRVIVREDPRLPLVSINAVFRGGLLAETPEKAGITRLAARSMIKGTKTRSAEQIASEIENVGGSISSDSGNNSFNFSVDVMKPDLGLGLEILADVLRNATFEEREVETERRAQLAAIKAEGEQPTAVARNLTRERLFEGHPYALRNLGTTESVSAIQPQDLKAFRDAYVTARNGVVTVFGDVRAEEVRRAMEKTFGKLPAGELAFSSAPGPAALEGTISVEGAIDKKQAIVMVGFRGTTAAGPDRAALELIGEASNDLGSRFFNRIREQLGLAYFVGAAQFHGLAPGAFIFYLGTDPAKSAKVLGEFRDEIGKLGREGLTQEELERAKKKLLGGEAIRNQSNAAFAQACAVDELMGLGWDNFRQRGEEIGKITLDDVRRVASEYFDKAGRVETLVQPASTPSAPTPP